MLELSRTSSINVSYRQTTAQKVDTRPAIYVSATIPAAEDLARQAGWQICELGSLETLGTDSRRNVPTCVVVHLSQAALDAGALIEDLFALPASVPFICIADDVDLATVVSVMKAGALDVLRMPVNDTMLLAAINAALQRSAAILEQERVMSELKGRYEALSQRERQVMVLLASGLLNKQVGGELGISEITVKAHRGRVMSKMQANSFASLVKMATTLAI